MKDVCRWLVEVKGGDKLICGGDAIGEVTIKGRVGEGKIPVCRVHQAEHNERAASLRHRIRN